MHEYAGRDQTCGLQKLQVAPLTVPLFLEGRYPGIAAHLRACGPCGEDFEGLLAAVRGEAD